MAAIFDYEIVEGAPGVAAAATSVFGRLKAHEEAWFARQPMPVAPTLADAEALLDRFARTNSKALNSIYEMAWETMEWEFDEAVFNEAAGRFELIGISPMAPSLRQAGRILGSEPRPQGWP